MPPTTFGGGFGFPKVQKSKAVYGNGLTITAARLTATTTGNVVFSLGTADNPDGTSVTFEPVTSGSTHTFNSTNTWLYWSAVGDPGAIVTNITINNISDS